MAVVRGLDLRVEPGEVVALIGPNGAGKTTTLLTLSGELPPIAGEVRFNGEVTKAPLFKRARRGLGFVTEERSVFMRLSTADNLRLARVPRRDATALFPELEPLMGRRTGLLSGGEQQMLALARALARKPTMLLADELSLGLAPLVVQRLLRAVRRRRGCARARCAPGRAARSPGVADRRSCLRHATRRDRDPRNRSRGARTARRAGSDLPRRHDERVRSGLRPVAPAPSWRRLRGAPSW